MGENENKNDNVYDDDDVQAFETSLNWLKNIDVALKMYIT